ncbi:MAG: hypothetical protein ACRC37_02740 [Lentisphaeria bacterium]
MKRIVLAFSVIAASIVLASETKSSTKKNILEVDNSAELVKIKAESEKVDTLAIHRTIAKFDGLRFRQCRGRTSLCPDKCGDSGEFAIFTIKEYLKYEKPGQYGDPKQTQFMIMATDYERKPLDSPFGKMIAQLELNDEVELDWDHLYVKNKTGGQFPVRPVLKIKKIIKK